MAIFCFKILNNARDEGIEPPLEVLETPVLPLYESRLCHVKRGDKSLFCFTMQGMLFGFFRIHH